MINNDRKRIIDHFGEKKIVDRYDYIRSKIYDFLTSKKVLDYTLINSDILDQVIIDYFADVLRLKEFHEIEKANSKKITSYMAYWLLRRKPIQIVSESNKSKVIDPFLNEKFVVSYIAKIFFVPKYELVPPDEQIAKETEEFLTHLLYHFKYRPIYQQDIELMLFAFEIGNIFGKGIVDTSVK